MNGAGAATINGWQPSVKRTVRVGDFDMTYRSDNFTQPWRTPETVLMVHGNAESGLAWYGWVPHLAKDFRVLRPDFRGFGESTPMPEDYPWTLDVLVADLIGFLDTLGVARVHVIGAKIGGMISLHLAATRPERVSSLTVLGTPVSGATLSRADNPLEEIRTKGIAHWARRSMGPRLGSALPPEAHEWWIQFMARTPLSSQLGFIGKVGTFEVGHELGQIKCPTLVVTTDTENLVGAQDTVRPWQQKIPNSELAVIKSDAYHVAAAAADEAAQTAGAFIRRHASRTA
jgi:pimeloyl-ACP methyl ester carboxylesterase